MYMIQLIEVNVTANIKASVCGCFTVQQEFMYQILNCQKGDFQTLKFLGKNPIFEDHFEICTNCVERRQ